jgi:hypothetical protein
VGSRRSGDAEATGDRRADGLLRRRESVDVTAEGHVRIGGSELGADDGDGGAVLDRQRRQRVAKLVRVHVVDAGRAPQAC